MNNILDESNKKSQEILLKHFFTSDEKNIYFIKNNLPNTFFNKIKNEYIWKREAFKATFLEFFSKNVQEMWTLEEEIKQIHNNNTLTINSLFETADDDSKNTKYAKIVFENISMTAINILKSEFKDDWSFEVQKIDHENLLENNLLFPEDLQKSKYFEEIQAISKKAIQIHNLYAPKIKNILWEKIFSKKNLNKKTNKILKHIIPLNISTTLFLETNKNNLENLINFMLSHPLDELQKIGKTTHSEALKIFPEEVKYVWNIEYQLNSRENLNKYINELLWVTNKIDEEIGLYTWIDDSEKVNIVFEWDLDDHICACLIFYNSKKESVSYEECLDMVEHMWNWDKKELITVALNWKTAFNTISKAFSHSSAMFELVLKLQNFQFFLDIPWIKTINQWTNWIIGYDYPESIDIQWLENFKVEYDILMTDYTLLANKIIKENPYLAEYTSCFGHLIRSTFEAPANVLSNLIEQNSDNEIFINMHNELKKYSPIFSSFIKTKK